MSAERAAADWKREALLARSRLAAAEAECAALQAEVERLRGAPRVALVTAIHRWFEFENDHCDHGTFTGGAQHGQSYAMCERLAVRLQPWDAAAQAVERVKALDLIAACGYCRRHYSDPTSGGTYSCAHVARVLAALSPPTATRTMRR